MAAYQTIGISWRKIIMQPTFQQAGFFSNIFFLLRISTAPREPTRECYCASTDYMRFATLESTSL